MASSPNIKLISECFIKPKFEPKQSIQPYHLAPDDLMMISLHYMQKGLLFAKPSTFTTSDFTSLLDKLKLSLSLALVHFYPLAGRLATERYEDEHCCSIYVDCNKGPGARFIHATVDVTASDLHHALPTVRSFFDLGKRAVVNHDGHSGALLSVQVTELLDAVFIGFTMNHAVADGTSLWHFIHTLSEIFNNFNHNNNSSGLNLKDVIPNISRVPIYRSLSQVINLPFLDPDEFITRSTIHTGILRERIFQFSATSVATLKAKANADIMECSSCHNTCNVISSFQSLSSLVWRSITRARGLTPGSTTTCSLVVNSRPRLDPPLSPDHFGNFGLMAQGKAEVGELLGNGLGWGALKLNQAVQEQDDKAARRAWEEYVKAPFVAKPGWSTPFFGSNPIVIGGSPRFNMYGAEFGMGRATAVLSGYANKDEGKVTANPGRDGGGSVDIEVCLSAQTMRALELDQEFMGYVS